MDIDQVAIFQVLQLCNGPGWLSTSPTCEVMTELPFHAGKADAASQPAFRLSQFTFQPSLVCGTPTMGIFKPGLGISARRSVVLDVTAELDRILPRSGCTRCSIIRDHIHTTYNHGISDNKCDNIIYTGAVIVPLEIMTAPVVVMLLTAMLNVVPSFGAICVMAIMMAPAVPASEMSATVFNNELKLMEAARTDLAGRRAATMSPKMKKKRRQNNKTLNENRFSNITNLRFKF